MALRLASFVRILKCCQRSPIVVNNSIARVHVLSKIGDREIVGYGRCGDPVYFDRIDFPMPPVRFKEFNTEELCCLRGKECNDWRDMTWDEKRTLYRASFCQTLAEVKAPTGHWKMCIGQAMWAVTLALWIILSLEAFVYDPPPDTFNIERKQAQLRRMINLEVNPITGLTSNWDYENDKWKD